MPFQFLQPGLLWGALLLAVPLLIHLFNRRRYLRRPWAAMSFLEAAFKKVRRRVRLENLLLLLLRCALPVLLALALARPLVQGDSLLAGLAEAPRHHILVVDATLSNDQKAQAEPRPLARARSLAGRYLQGLPEAEFQKVTLIRLDSSAQVLLEHQGRVDPVLEALPALCRPGFGAAPLAQALELALEVHAEGEARPRVLVFTDMQRSAFGAEPSSAAEADPLTLALARLHELGGEPVTFLDTGPSRVPPNATLLSLEAVEPVAVRGFPIEVRARIRNHALEALENVQLLFELDGERLPADTVRLPARGTAEVAIRFPVFAEGPHMLRAALPADALEGDDSAWLSLDVRGRIRVLLVDGRPDADFLLSAAGYLGRLLDPSGSEELEGVTLFAAASVSHLDFQPGPGDLEQHDVVVLAEPERLDPRAAERLAAFVQGGGGLLAVPGGGTEPAAWNLRLAAEGAALLPLRLLEARGEVQRGSTYFVPRKPAGIEHPILREFQGPLELLLGEAPVYRFMAALQARPTAQVLLALSDPEGSPLLAVDRFGLGKVALLTSPITADDRRWNELGSPILAYPLLFPTLTWLARESRGALNLRVGQPLAARFVRAPREIHVTPPGGRPVPLRGQAHALPEGDFGWTPWAGVDQPGAYRLDLSWPEGLAPDEAPFRLAAANVDPSEGDLERFGEEGLKNRLREAPYRLERELPERDAPAAAGGGEIGYRLLYAVLALLAAEGLLAALIGRGRR